MSILFYAADPTPPDPFENFTGDDFTGTNGSPLNTNYWSVYGAYSDEWEIQNNKASINLTTENREALSVSLFTLPSDFDIQIDIDSIVASNPGGAVIRFNTFDSGFHNGCFGGVQVISGVKNFHASHLTNDVYDSQTNVARANDYGKLKIVRTGTNVVYSCQDGGGGWVQIKTKDQGSATTMFVYLHARSLPSTSITGNFDNFTINSGVVVAP